MYRIETIFVMPGQGVPARRVDRVQARAGRGLDGDYNQRPPRTEADPKPEEQLTLISAEALEALDAAGLALAPGASRRNLVTRGIDLNTLVGRTFRVGDARARGLEPCHPCERLEMLTRPGVLRALVNRGGLRAELLSDGLIREGDPIEVE